MEFEWDENKNNSNIEKHGISFDEAKEVFSDKKLIRKRDIKKDYGEIRFIGIGQALEKILVVVYTMREKATRLISARKANKKEKEIYHERTN